MRRTHAWLGLPLLLLGPAPGCGGSALAEPPLREAASAESSEEAREREELVREIVRIVDPEARRRAWIEYQTTELDGWYENTLFQEMTTKGIEQELRPLVTPALIAASQQRYARRVAERLQNEVDYPDIYLEVYRRSYNEMFSLEELRGLVAFYRTPAGTKLARNLPDLSVNLLDTQVAVGDKTSQFISETFEEEIAWLREQVSGR